MHASQCRRRSPARVSAALDRMKTFQHNASAGGKRNTRSGLCQEALIRAIISNHEHSRSSFLRIPVAVPSSLRNNGAKPMAWCAIRSGCSVPAMLGRALVLALAPLPFKVTWCDSRDGGISAACPGQCGTGSHRRSGTRWWRRRQAGAFVLAMTHSHPLDLAVTAAALARADLPYVGLIGSATKRGRLRRSAIGRTRYPGSADRSAFLPDRNRRYHRTRIPPLSPPRRRRNCWPGREAVAAQEKYRTMHDEEDARFPRPCRAPLTRAYA